MRRTVLVRMEFYFLQRKAIHQQQKKKKRERNRIESMRLNKRVQKWESISFVLYGGWTGESITTMCNESMKLVAWRKLKILSSWGFYWIRARHITNTTKTYKQQRQSSLQLTKLCSHIVPVDARVQVSVCVCGCVGVYKPNRRESFALEHCFCLHFIDFLRSLFPYFLGIFHHFFTSFTHSLTHTFPSIPIIIIVFKLLHRIYLLCLYFNQSIPDHYAHHEQSKSTHTNVPVVFVWWMPTHSRCSYCSAPNRRWSFDRACSRTRVSMPA